MVVCSLPEYLCSQRYFYYNEFGMKEVAIGLRQDMKQWISNYCSDDCWGFNLVYNNVDFVFPSRAIAALFILYWSQEKPILDHAPIPRPKSYSQ
jgi:hypothetical protein